METWTCLLSKILHVRDGNSDQAVNVIKDIVRKRKISEEVNYTMNMYVVINAL